jgi:serine/threonine protein kinase
VLSVGGQIGRYILVDKLGQGSFGLVFRARDTVLDRMVAIKVLNPAHQYNADVLRRFLQEALASARVCHPGIVTVHDFGTVKTSMSETAYIVLELLQGESLSARIARTGRLQDVWAVEIIRQVASALDTAHRAGVLHRDLKSDNIYLVADPAAVAGERVKVLDFGLAKVGAGVHTAHNTVFGTPKYMSPEQCRSAAEIDERSDIYSLGCVLFELLTGRTPFNGELRALLDAHKRAMPPRVVQFVPEISTALDELVAKMLAKDPAQRPQTMLELHDALYAINALAAQQPAGTPPPRDGFESGAFTAVRAMPIDRSGPCPEPYVAATVLPMPAPSEPAIRPSDLAMQPISYGRTESVKPLPRGKRAVVPITEPADVVSLPRPGSVKYQLAPHLPALQKSPVRASLIGAAITLIIAAALTAIAARGHIKPAAADPVPDVPAAN